MPIGHTDKATINKRRPLTQNMLEFLGSVRVRERLNPGVMFKGEMTQGEKNAAKALMTRGMIGWDVGLQGYYLKDAGRTILDRERS